MVGFISNEIKNGIIKVEQESNLKVEDLNQNISKWNIDSNNTKEVE